MNNMTVVEKMGLEALKKFIDHASKKGICYNGENMDKTIQDAVIEVVREYVEEYENYEE